jgi:hypothetical protein
LSSVLIISLSSLKISLSTNLRSENIDLAENSMLGAGTMIG